MAPDHPEHSDNLPENRGQPQPSARKALGHCPPHGVPGTRTYFIYVLAFPSGKTYGCFFRKTCPTRLQGTISRLPPHIHTLKEISARQPRPRHSSASRAGGDTGWQFCGTRCQGTSKSKKGLRAAPGLGCRVKSGARSQTVHLTAGKPVSPSADGDDSSHLEGWWDFTRGLWPARGRSTHLNQPWHTFGASHDALGQKREALGSARAPLPDTWKFSVQKALRCV